MDNQDNIYSVRLNDYSAPSFISSCICYYGTEKEIMNLIKQDADRPDIILAAEEYFLGKGPSKESLFGEKPSPIISSVKLIDTATYKRSNFRYKFINIWDCGIDINIEHMDAVLIYILDSDGKYKRCVKAVIKNATYATETNESRMYIGNGPLGYWGYPGYIENNRHAGGQFILKNSLYFVDTIFKSKECLRSDVRKPHKPYLRQFFFGIFGDG